MTRADWPEDYWEWVAENRESLEIGDVKGLGVGFLDVSLDDE